MKMQKKQHLLRLILAMLIVSLCGLMSGCGDMDYEETQVVTLGSADSSLDTSTDDSDWDDSAYDEPDTSAYADTDDFEYEDTDDSAYTDTDYDEGDDTDYDDTDLTYTFRNDTYLQQHYEKHGIEMGFDSPESYEAAASAVINNPDALTKTEAEDGDYVYYLEDTNEFVILSTDGYIRTYFYPSAGKSYYDRQ